MVKKVLKPNEYRLNETAGIGKPRAQNYHIKLDPLLRPPNSFNNTRK